MKDYLLLIRETRQDLEMLGIKCGKVRDFKVNTRAKKRWGQCKRVSFDTFDIEISSRLLEDSLDDTVPKNVIAHELLHTVKGCFEHRGRWKSLADKVNSALPDYNIKVRDSFEEYGINTQTENRPKYVIVCTDCGFRFERMRKSNVVKNPQMYRCAKCKGKLTVHLINE